MTTNELHDFTITVVPPAGTVPSTHPARSTDACHALADYLYAIENCGLVHTDHVVRNINEVKGVARASMNGTIYIAAPTNPKPAAPETNMGEDIPMSELEG